MSKLLIIGCGCGSAGILNLALPRNDEIRVIGVPGALDSIDHLASVSVVEHVSAVPILSEYLENTIENDIELIENEKYYKQLDTRFSDEEWSNKPNKKSKRRRR